MSIVDAYESTTYHTHTQKTRLSHGDFSRRQNVLRNIRGPNACLSLSLLYPFPFSKGHRQVNSRGSSKNQTKGEQMDRFRLCKLRTSAQASGSASARNSKKHRCFNSLSRLAQNRHHFQPHFPARNFANFGESWGYWMLWRLVWGFFRRLIFVSSHSRTRDTWPPHAARINLSAARWELFRRGKGFARTAFARSDPISLAISRYARLPLSQNPTVTATK